MSTVDPIVRRAGLYDATFDSPKNVGVAAQVLAFIEPVLTPAVPAIAFTVLVIAPSVPAITVAIRLGRD